MITYQKEQFTAIMHELPEIFYIHWKEIALDKDKVKLNPDWNKYVYLQTVNMLHIITVRDDGKLIGYFFAVIYPHLHYVQSLTSFSDLLYILPEYRKGNIGYKLLKEVDKMHKELGVQKSYMMTKVHNDVGILFERLGYKFNEKIYTKVI